MTMRIAALTGLLLLAVAACQGKKDELDGGPTRPTETPHNPGPVPPLNVPSAAPSASSSPN